MELQQHVCEIRRLDPAEAKELECETCGKFFLYRSNLKKHMSVHKNKKHPKQLSCLFCQYRCYKNFDLTKHLATHSGVKRVKNYKCAHCDYATVTQYYLNVHINARHTNKTHRCRNVK